jgi:hypothetical protein
MQRIVRTILEFSGVNCETLKASFRTESMRQFLHESWFFRMFPKRISLLPEVSKRSNTQIRNISGYPSISLRFHLWLLWSTVYWWSSKWMIGMFCLSVNFSNDAVLHSLRSSMIWAGLQTTEFSGIFVRQMSHWRESIVVVPQCNIDLKFVNKSQMILWHRNVFSGCPIILVNEETPPAVDATARSLQLCSVQHAREYIEKLQRENGVLQHSS